MNMARPTAAQRSRAPDTRTVPAALLRLARFDEALADAAECLRHDAASIKVTAAPFVWHAGTAPLCMEPRRHGIAQRETCVLSRA